MKTKIFFQALALLLLQTVTVNAQDSISVNKEQVSKETTSNTQDITSETAKDLIPVVRFGNDIKVKLGGFFRAEYYVDSREIVGASDGLFGFFPQDKVYDANGDDLNEVVRQNFSTQATRFTATVDGSNLGEAKSKAYVEFDFSGGNDRERVLLNSISRWA